ncbi:MAG TPA: hypothetical protein DCY07_05980 [Rhodospirillaceae bacterium]|nr:hypothetical protein [Rhodospirillaceae bacterium]
MKQIIKNNLTFVLQRLYFALATEATDRLPPAESGGLMVIAPHPDDETLGCGALIARMRANGVPVRIIVVTDGSAAPTLQPMPRESLVAMRRSETQKAVQALGVQPESIVFLDYQDGKAAQSLSAIAQDIASQIWLHAPALILSPYGLDAHDDHRAVADAIDHLCASGKITVPVFEYPMWFWPVLAFRQLLSHPTRGVVRKIPAQDFLVNKTQAANAYQSQFGALTGEAGIGHLPKGFMRQNLQAYELFFEKEVTHKHDKI